MVDPSKHLQVKLGPIVPSGFPVRVLTRPDYGECGEWITAYQAEQRQHLKAVMKSSKLDEKRSKMIYPPTNTREASSVLHPVLNKLFLLLHCFVSTPEDLCVANITEKDLRDYKSEDFLKFVNLVSINASDNHLPFEAFKTFPALQSLELSLNSITDISLEIRVHFKHLQFLDLSFNNLCAGALLRLGLLPALKELHLTGNNLVALPVEMPVPYKAQGSGKLEVRFPVLEKLWLDDNKLCDQTTFATLAGLRKLKYLNLDNNEIYHIPKLKLLGTSNLQPSVTPEAQNHDRNPDRVNLERSSKDYSSKEDERMASLSTKLEGSFLSNSSLKDDEKGVAQGGETVTSSEVGGHDRITSAPAVSFRDQSLKDQQEMSIQSKSDSFIKFEKLKEVSKLDSTQPTSAMSTTSIPIPGSKTSGAEASIVSHTMQQADKGSPVESGVDGKMEQWSPNQREDKSSEERGLEGKIESWSPTQVMEMNQSGSELLPFPCLTTLSLINNLVLSSEGVIACSSWPALSEIILYDNPFTRTCKGMPELLQSHLVDQLGITVVRKKPEMEKHSTHIRKIAKDFKKVSSGPPPAIPKRPLPAIEAPPTTVPTPMGSLLDRPHVDSQESLSSGSESETSQDSSDSNGIFITQVDVGGENEPLGGERLEQQKEEPSFSTRDAFLARLNQLKEKYKNIPQRYRGYEALLDVEDDPGDRIPADIRGCTKALQYALKHSVLKPDQVDKQRPLPHRKVKPIEPGTAKASYKVTQLKQVLDEMRTQSHSIEANLGDVLAPKTPAQKVYAAELRKESKKLLAEMQAHYDQVRASSLHPTTSGFSSSRQPSIMSATITKRPKSVRFS